MIEVMFAMAIIGVVLAAGYSTASKNLQTSQLAKERTQATKIAESQLEQLKVLADPPGITDFCIDVTKADEIITYDSNNTDCVEGFYSKHITKSGNQYTVLVEWIPPGGSDTNKANVTFHYSDYDFSLAGSASIGVSVTSFNGGAGTATLGATYSEPGIISQGIVYSTNYPPKIGASGSISIEDQSDPLTGSFSIDITGLLSGEIYYARSWIVTTAGLRYSSVTTIETPPASVKPTVVTGAAGSIGIASATVAGDITSEGGSTVFERGVVFSTSTNPSYNAASSTAVLDSSTGGGPYSVTLSLLPGTTYYARAYAENDGGLAYGSEVSFTTATAPPELVYTGESNGSTYYLSINTATCSEAIGIAASSGGHLVTIGSATENATVSNFAVGFYIWIGYSDSVVEGNWQWVTGEPKVYENWRFDDDGTQIEPNDYINGVPGEDCAVMNWAGSAQWNDWYDNATTKAFYVIEYEQ